MGRLRRSTYAGLEGEKNKIKKLDLIILGDSTTVLEEADRDEVLQPQLIEFTYTLWIGQNLTEIYNLNMKIPVNTSFYEAMLIAAETDSNYQFVNQTTNHFHTIISL